MKDFGLYCLLTVMIFTALAIVISISEISKKNFKRNILIAVIAVIALIIEGAILIVNFS